MTLQAHLFLFEHENISYAHGGWEWQLRLKSLLITGVTYRYSSKANARNSAKRAAELLSIEIKEETTTKLHCYDQD